jgi:hypothetical protein
VYVVYGRLWMCIVLHGFGNFLIVLAVNSRYVMPFLQLLDSRAFQLSFLALVFVLIPALLRTGAPLLGARLASPFSAQAKSR